MKLIYYTNYRYYFIISKIVLIIFLLLSCNKDDSNIPDNTIGGYYIDKTYNWPASAPEDQGFDQSLLSNTIDYAKQTDYIYSVLVVRNRTLHGKL